MKRLLIATMILIFVLGCSITQAESRVTESFNQGWIFALAKPGTENVSDIAPSHWRRVELPHDWSVEHRVHESNPSSMSGGYYRTGLGFYTKTFSLPQACKDKQVYIDFDGVYMNSEVWINGKYLGKRPYGYSSFRYDLTEYLKFGEDAKNEIVVKVDNTKQISARWYTGSGIYRNVRLVIADPVHVDHWGIYVTTPEVSKDSALVEIKTTLRNASARKRDIVLRSTITSGSGDQEEVIATTATISANDAQSLVQRVKFKNPKLWSAEKPVLYTLRTEILEGGKVLDDYLTSFGIRTFKFDAQKGFFINGKREKLKGVCLHEDGGSVGTAVPRMVWARRLSILKEMGCNAVRTSHNPFRPYFYELCDEMGFYVIDEAFDEWKIQKRDASYYLYFEQEAERDLADMILRDRNHPSIIMWSIGNEIRDTKVEEGIETTKWLVDICHKIDPTRPATIGLNALTKPNEYGISDIVDVMGYNFGHAEDKYTKDFLAYPDRKKYGSETTHSFQTRGVYFTKTFRKNADKQPDLTEAEIFNFNPAAYNSSYDNAFIEHHNRYSLAHMRDNDWLAGEFRWTGIDYLGEAGNFPSRFKNFGIIDMCGYPKDTYYLYQSVWTDKNILHILPHWNWPGMEGVKIPVWVYANNCDQVELFLNDTSLGKKDFNTKELYCSWLVEYVPGVLKAVATQNGKVVNTKLMPTAGDAAKIELQIDTDKISANHEDVVHAEVRILDDAGNFVPDADNRVTFDVIGPARIIGVDNGDPIDHDPLKANSRKAFNGMCLAIIQSNLTGGKVSITAKSKGLTPVSASFSIVKDPSASKLHKSIVDRKITYEISDHERRLGIIEEIKAIPEEGPTSNPKDLSKEEKIKLREARKANRNNKTN